MDDWDKMRRQRRFRNKNIHAEKGDQAPRQKSTKADRKIDRQRIDPEHWADQDEFYEEFSEDFTEF